MSLTQAELELVPPDLLEAFGVTQAETEALWPEWAIGPSIGAGLYPIKAEHRCGCPVPNQPVATALDHEEWKRFWKSFCCYRHRQACSCCGRMRRELA